MTTEIEELLRKELSSQVDGVHLAGDPFQAALRRYRRRRVMTGGVAGVAAVTAGALAAAAVVGGSTSGQHGGTVAGPQSHAQSPVAVAPNLETVAYVRQHILQAVDPMHAIVRTFATVGSQTNDNWLDQDTGYITDYTHDGGVLTGVTHYPQWKAGVVTEVDYRTRTYYVTHQDAVQPPPSTQTSGKAGEPWLASVADIKAAIRRADVQILGPGTFAGRPATHLRFTYRAGGGTIRGDAWFDSQTYAPLRASTTYLSAPATASGAPADGSAGISVPGPGAPGSAAPPAPAVTATTSFLARTAANLAKTRLAIPAGFVRVSPPSK